jgi:hypothetical protein
MNWLFLIIGLHFIITGFNDKFKILKQDNLKNDKERETFEFIQNNKITFRVIGVIFFIIGLSLFNIKQEDENKEIKAFTYCQIFVEKRLKAPASAKFHIEDFSFLKYEDNSYTIKSYVDSQNSYGAMIRSDFICRVSFNENNEAILESLEIK